MFLRALEVLEARRLPVEMEHRVPCCAMALRSSGQMLGQEDRPLMVLAQVAFLMAETDQMEAVVRPTEFQDSRWDLAVAVAAVADLVAAALSAPQVGLADCLAARTLEGPAAEIMPPFHLFSLARVEVAEVVAPT